MWLGQLDQAEATCRRMIALHDDYLRRCGRRLPIAAFGYARLSDIRRERNDLDQALRLALESRSLAEQWQQTDALFESYLQLARALHASGDPDSALALLRRLETLVADRSPWLHSITRAHEAGLCVACAADPACLDRAHRWARDQPLPANSRFVFRDHPLYLSHAQLLLHDGRTDQAGARSGLELVRNVLKLLEPSGALGLTLQASVIRALLEDALGRPADALATLADCLRRAEPCGYVRLFLDQGAPMNALLGKLLSADPSFGYARALRDAFAVQGPLRALQQEARGRPGIPAMEEPLSERELDVLRLLASTMASSEIADRLCVATSTVRSHTKAIYGKLGVHTRLEAIDQARELGLI
jgi:LuxR family maltose regulon positive regulatory protein